MPYEVKHMERLYNTDDVNTQFIHSMVCQDYEKHLIEEILKKRVMNGSVPNSVDLPRQREIDEECAALHKVFYDGEVLTEFEKDLQRIYLSNKLQKHVKFQSRKVNRFKVKWTVSDLNRYQDQENYRMIDQEYFGTAKPTFMPFDLDTAMKCMETH